MSQDPPLLWVMRNTYAGQCIHARKELIFAGDGFLVHVLPSGRVALRAADAESSEPLGWMLSAMAEFLAPVGGRRTREGVSVPVGHHVVHFGPDGRVRVDREEDGGRREAAHGRSRRHAVSASAEAAGRSHARIVAVVRGREGFEPRIRPTEVPLLGPPTERSSDAARWADDPSGSDTDAPAGEPDHPWRSAVDDLCRRWAPGTAHANLRTRAHAAREDRLAIRRLLDALRAEGPLHAGPRRSLTLRLLALDRFLREQATHPNPA